MLQIMLFDVFVLSIYSFLFFDRHYTVSAEVNALPGKIKIHIAVYEYKLEIYIM